MKPIQALKVWAKCCDRFGIRWFLYKETLLCANGYHYFPKTLPNAQIAVRARDLSDLVEHVFPTLPSKWKLDKAAFIRGGRQLVFKVKNQVVLEINVLYGVENDAQMNALSKELKKVQRKTKNKLNTRKFVNKVGKKLLRKLYTKTFGKVVNRSMKKITNEAFEAMINLSMDSNEKAGFYTDFMTNKKPLMISKALFATTETVTCAASEKKWDAYLIQQEEDALLAAMEEELGGVLEVVDLNELLSDEDMNEEIDDIDEEEETVVASEDEEIAQLPEKEDETEPSETEEEETEETAQPAESEEEEESEEETEEHTEETEEHAEASEEAEEEEDEEEAASDAPKKRVKVAEFPVLSGYHDYLSAVYGDYENGLTDEIGLGLTVAEKEELRQHQARCFEALTFLQEVSKEFNLRYYLIAGSVLGAVRHGGFIPWDDDIDIGVRLEEIKHFEAVVKENFHRMPEGFTLEQPGANNPYPRMFSKICFNGRCCIDIWPLIPTYRDGFGAKYLWYFGKIITKIHYQKIGYQVTKFQNVAKVADMLMSDKMVMALARRNEKRYVGKNAPAYINLYSIYKRHKETMKRVWLDEEATEIFNGLEVPVVGNTKVYLTHLYGNYMAFPAPWKRVSRHVTRF